MKVDSYGGTVAKTSYFRVTACSRCSGNGAVLLGISPVVCPKCHGAKIKIAHTGGTDA